MIADLIKSNGGDGEWPLGQACRPLGKISDFVVNELPGWSSLVTEEADIARSNMFAERMGKIVPQCMAASIDHPIGLLDAKMIYTMISLVEDRYHTDGLAQMRQVLERKIRQSAHNLGASPIAALSYEDIIISNPRTEPRVFLPGAAGRSELAFYLAHQQIEELLGDALDKMDNIRRAPELTELGREQLRRAHDEIKSVNWGMMSFVRELDREHFGKFRMFFSTNPFTGEKGPSGAFSAKVPHVDILLYGREVPVDVQRYLEENAAYFPPRDLAAARAAMAQPVSLVDMLASKGDIEAKERCKHIAQQMLMFRNIHKGAVAKHMGQGVVGSAEGGHAADFLETRRRQYQAAYDMAAKRLSASEPLRPYIMPGDKRFHIIPSHKPEGNFS